MDFDINTVITIVTVCGGLIAQAAYLKGSITQRLNNHEKDIDSIQQRVRWSDTCNAMTGEQEAVNYGLDKRISLLEAREI